MSVIGHYHNAMHPTQFRMIMYGTGEDNIALRGIEYHATTRSKSDEIRFATLGQMRKIAAVSQGVVADRHRVILTGLLRRNQNFHQV